MVNLETTNWLLGVMAVAQRRPDAAAGGRGRRRLRLYRQVSTTRAGSRVAARGAAAAAGGRAADQVDASGEVQTIAARVSHRTERVDHAITGTIERVDETAEQLKDSVRDKVSQATGVVRGIRAVIASLLTTEPRSKPPAQAGGRP